MFYKPFFYVVIITNINEFKYGSISRWYIYPCHSGKKPIARFTIQIQKNIENKNAELAMLEIDYINRENITMLKDGSVLSFVQAENIIYTSNIPEPNGLALVDKN